jgi:hypothetical protein
MTKFATTTRYPKTIYYGTKTAYLLRQSMEVIATFSQKTQQPQAFSNTEE